MIIFYKNVRTYLCQAGTLEGEKYMYHNHLCNFEKVIGMDNCSYTKLSSEIFCSAVSHYFFNSVDKQNVNG